MEITAIIKNVVPVQTGTSQQGNQWKRQTIVVEYGDRYPKEVALTLFNDKVDTYSQHLSIGMRLKFHFDIESREYNGRWYTECMAWKIESLQPQPQAGGYVPPQTKPYPSVYATPQPAPQQNLMQSPVQTFDAPPF